MASIKEQLMRMAVTQLRMSTGETYAERLKREVDRLYDCIQDEIDKYYLSYTPKVYSRTGMWKDSMYAEDLADIRIEGNQIRLSVKTDPRLAYHWNITGDHLSFVPLLMESGWWSRNLEAKIGVRDRFTRYEGAHCVKKGIEHWNRNNSLGLTIDVTAIYEGTQYSIF